MPFTFSHPAAILPFRLLPRKWFSFTALVTGSLVPDFEYFIRLKDDSFYSHKFWGIWWFDLPFALALAFLFHGYIRKPLLENLPVFIQHRFAHYYHFDWPAFVIRNLPAVLLSLLAGVLTHLLWDRLTHETAYFFQKIPDVQQHLITERRRKLSYYLWWYGNSLAGGFLLLIYAWKRAVPGQLLLAVPRIDFWLRTSVLTLVLFLIRLLCGNALFVGDMIVSCISCALFSLLMVSILEPARYRQKYPKHMENSIA